jgi:hypothetical protein
MEEQALKILHLRPDFTLRELQDNYKRILFDTFPNLSDKASIESNPKYLMIKSSYDVALSALNERKQRAPMNPPPPPQSKSTMNDYNKGFNVNKFNALFEEHRLKDDALEKGYEHWMNNPNSFQERDVREKFKKYEEPQAMFMSFSSKAHEPGNFYELGVTKVGDFSADNVSNRTLNYMDYRVAHTASKIVDPDSVRKRKEYRTVDELQADRASLSLTMSPAEQAEFQKRQRQQEQREARRMGKLSQYDQLVSEHHAKTHQLFL